MPETLSDRQVEMLMLVCYNPGSTTRELARTLGRSATQGCVQSINSLIRKGLVSQESADHVVRYNATPEGKTTLKAAQMQTARDAAEYVRAVRRY
jgi:predicted transcriptional regulator